MADLSDVMSKIADLATTACYPNGTSGVSVTTRRIYIMQGWPKPQDMDQAMTSNYALVNIYAIQGSTGTVPQVFSKPQIIVPALSGLSATIDDATGTIVTLAGTPQVGEYVTAIVDKRAYSYVYATGNTAADFAAGLVALIIGDYPLARSDGSSLTIPGSKSILIRIAAPTTLGRTIHRQTQQIRVVVWANNPTDRNIVSAAIDVFLKQNLKISFADTSEAIVNYQGTYLDDNLQNTGEYRRDIIFTVTYATVEQFTGYAITSVGFSYSITTISPAAAVDPAVHLPVGGSTPPAILSGNNLAASPGSIALTGRAAALNIGLPAGSGTFALTGYAAANPLSPQVTQFFNRLLTLPSAPRQDLYAAMIDGLVADGVWSLLDVLCVAGADAATNLTNLVQAPYGATYVGSPVFTADRGLSGSGTVNYIDTGFNPSTVVGNLTQNSATLAAWNLGTAAGDAALIRSVPNVNCEIWPQYHTGVTFWMVNNSGGTENSVTNPGDPSGFYVATRTASNATAIYRNGTSLGTSATASTTPENNNFVLAYANPTTWTIASWAFGGALDATKATALYNRVQTYLHALGAV